ncbi:glyoxalase domain-containing protein 4 isoform X2 [Halyomorpha halys]|uniref:glyoxalase domain-containing protein 4 isoform X2 n=1 Tax=Halyomorpha halys TaxID=286706 RepID=UPI0006D51FE6|nr:glyoxalase domain-containing protein 4-like isoform X2 [Halyomorpha halys]
MEAPIKPRKYSCQLLHYIFKIVDRPKNLKFFQEILGMKVLRHEEYRKERSPSNKRPSALWSKTLFGYGPEDKYFAVELVWNSEVSSYDIGNAYEGITIISRESIARAHALKWPMKLKGHFHCIESPDGYNFFLIDEPQPMDKEPISHGSGKGKIVLSIPLRDLQDIETSSRDTNRTIIAPLKCVEISENKTVNLLFLADSDCHEICFLDEESFRIISRYDPLGEAFLHYSMKKFEKNVKRNTEIHPKISKKL